MMPNDLFELLEERIKEANARLERASDGVFDASIKEREIRSREILAFSQSFGALISAWSDAYRSAVGRGA